MLSSYWYRLVICYFKWHYFKSEGRGPGLRKWRGAPDGCVTPLPAPHSMRAVPIILHRRLINRTVFSFSVARGWLCNRRRCIFGDVSVSRLIHRRCLYITHQFLRVVLPWTRLFLCVQRVFELLCVSRSIYDVGQRHSYSYSLSLCLEFNRLFVLPFLAMFCCLQYCQTRRNKPDKACTC